MREVLMVVGVVLLCAVCFALGAAYADRTALNSVSPSLYHRMARFVARLTIDPSPVDVAAGNVDTLTPESRYEAEAILIAYRRFLP